MMNALTVPAAARAAKEYRVARLPLRKWILPVSKHRLARTVHRVRVP